MANVQCTYLWDWSNKTCICFQVNICWHCYHGATRFHAPLCVQFLPCKDAPQDKSVQSAFDDMQLIVSTHAVCHQPCRSFVTEAHTMLISPYGLMQTRLNSRTFVLNVTIGKLMCVYTALCSLFLVPNSHGLSSTVWALTDETARCAFRDKCLARLLVYVKLSSLFEIVSFNVCKGAHTNTNGISPQQGNHTDPWRLTWKVVRM